MVMRNSPCKDCKPPIRHVGCHDHCDRYLACKAEHEKEKEKRSKDIAKTNSKHVRF